MNLEGITLSEISQSQKDKYCMIPLIGGTLIVKIIKTEYIMVVSRSWGLAGEWGVIV